MGRYSCQKGKITSISKANKICLLRKCPHLIVQYQRGKFKTVVPVTMTDNLKGC